MKVALRANRLTEKILSWYHRERRDLPWRETTDPYAVWVSEVMLQQTQVRTVIPYYRRFIQSFPTVSALGEATLDAVLKTWENLGYYGRARNLHRAARIVVREMGGTVPDTLEGLTRLPGIGPYTAAAILSIAHEERIPAVDGNVSRVLSRLFLVRVPVNRPQGRKRIRDLALSILPETGPGQWNQALMDFGATLCKPKKPLCDSCPVSGECMAGRRGLQESLPVKIGSGTIPNKEMAAAVVRRNSGRILIFRRPDKGLLGGLWGFPIGEKRPEESYEEALHRILLDSLGIRVTRLTPLKTVRHAYTHFRMTVHPFDCLLEGDGPPPEEQPAYRWVSSRDMGTLALSRVDHKILDGGCGG
jgi:A/G-specific adenine glycosylase